MPGQFLRPQLFSHRAPRSQQCHNLVLAFAAQVKEQERIGIELFAKQIVDRGDVLAMETYAIGKHSDNGIAQILRQAGCVTKQGKSFTGEMGRAMLQNRTYIGEVLYQPYRRQSNGARQVQPHRMVSRPTPVHRAD